MNDHIHSLDAHVIINTHIHSLDAHSLETHVMIMMIAFSTINSGLVPLIEGLCVNRPIHL